MTADLHDQIRQRAFQIWQAEGHPEGRDFEHWLQAEAELNGAPAEDKPKKAAAPKAAPKAAAPKAAAPKTAAKKVAAPKATAKA